MNSEIKPSRPVLKITEHLEDVAIHLGNVNIGNTEKDRVAFLISEILRLVRTERP